MPAMTTTEFDESIGCIPAIKEDVDAKTGGQECLQLGQHLLGETALLAKTDAPLFGPLAVEAANAVYVNKSETEK